MGACASSQTDIPVILENPEEYKKQLDIFKRNTRYHKQYNLRKIRSEPILVRKFQSMK